MARAVLRRTYMVKPNDKEIDDVRNRCADYESQGTTRWHGMSYEQGVRAALDWVLGDSNDNPMDD